MKVTGLSWPRRYTCAAVNGLAAVTVPVTTPVPRMVDSAAGAGLATVTHKGSNSGSVTIEDFQRSRMGCSLVLVSSTVFLVRARSVSRSRCRAVWRHVCLLHLSVHLLWRRRNGDQPVVFAGHPCDPRGRQDA